jgi:hypothetical protein
VSRRSPRHRYCCNGRVMAQTDVATKQDMAAHPPFARLAPRIPGIDRNSRRDVRPMAARIATGRGLANPIFGRSRPTLGRQQRATWLCASAAGNDSLSLCRARAERRIASPREAGTCDDGLNGLFAISVNSPSMSMVNFSCCVGSKLPPVFGLVRGVTRRVTPQPMRTAVRMEAGDHACL